ncbi:MAG: hypothetical protein QOI78_141, partial [Actinomycetota bacterium]|nr:hypothetical protein [Actinomycetota bacterium]
MDSDGVDVTGQASVSPPVERESVAALLAAAREGNAQAQTALRAAVLPVIMNVVRRSGLGAADRAAVVQVVASALPRQVGLINDEDTLVLWLVAAVGHEVRRRDAHAVRLQGYV